MIIKRPVVANPRRVEKAPLSLSTITLEFLRSAFAPGWREPALGHDGVSA